MGTGERLVSIHFFQKERYGLYMKIILRNTIFEMMSVSELSEYTGVSKRVMYEMKSGKASAGMRAVDLITAAFPSLSFEELFEIVESEDEQN